MTAILQGAGICIEDGACLAECLDRAQTLDDLPRVLSAYQAIRRPRAEYCVQRARNFLAVLQLPDGEAQEQRDAVWSRVMQEGAWDGEHIDEPPEPSDIRLADGYVRGHDVFSYVSYGSLTVLCLMSAYNFARQTDNSIRFLEYEEKDIITTFIPWQSYIYNPLDR